MPSKESLTLLERQVALPGRRRLWLFVFACLAASMIGAAVAVAISIRGASVVILEPGPSQRNTASGDARAQREAETSTCPTTTMNAALTKAEWQGLLDTDELARAMRIVPAFRAGKPIGFKLYAIRPDSIWAGIGLENGDTLRRLQGQELATSDQALALYNQLQRRAPSAIYADLIRSGCPATLQVSLLDY